MPSFLSDILSEPVTLDASDSSLYEPPHQHSQEKALSQSPVTTEASSWHLPNGNSVETPASNKHASGIASGGKTLSDTRSQPVLTGRLSESTYSRDGLSSRDESSYSTTSGIGGSSESGRKSPGFSSGISMYGSIDQLQPKVLANGNIGIPAARAKASEGVGITSERSVRSRVHASSLPQTRHQRSMSASTSSNAPSLTPVANLDQSLSESNLLGANKLSSSIYPTLNPSNTGSSTALQHPGLTRLKHRHTLQVPKVSTSRTSRDFSWSQGDTSDDTYTNSFSPTTAARRGSLSLARRTTRSIHSEVYLDEIPQDGDAARWSETIRQKRASRRKRKEEEEDNRVMVGTKVDQHHVNWVTAYNMLTGIRFTVSRTNAKIDRELTDGDFDARHKFSFDITGNELTPSAKYDFKFKDYAPWVFRHLRAKFRLDPADYLISLTSKYILSELGSPGKSGSFFYFSRDYKYIIKTIHHAEHKLLRKVLRDYYAHIEENPNTLISQFYGLHRVKIPYGRKIHFVVMNNLFPPHRDIHQTFDLKGSTIGRDFQEEDLEKNPRATLKDLNWLRRNYHLEFGPEKKNLFVEQMMRDVALLQKLKIMDYSLLVGIHDLSKGNDENLRDKTLQVFQPGVEHGEEAQSSLLTRTPSKLENARKARELRNIIKREKPVRMDQSNNKMPEQQHEERKDFLFYSDDGGFKATHDDGRPGDEIYYLGIIDCLTHYGFIKKAEHFWKGMSSNKLQISPIPPEGYGDRFVKFITGITMPREEAEKQSPDQMNGSVHTHRLSSHQITRSSTDRVMEEAEKQAKRTEDQGATENECRDRTLSAARSSSIDRSSGMAGATLPVVEEVGEGASTGDQSGRSCEGDQGSSNSSPPMLNVSVLHSPPLGGRPPPTPPKDSFWRDKQLPVIPDLPRSVDSPTTFNPV